MNLLRPSPQELLLGIVWTGGLLSAVVVLCAWAAQHLIPTAVGRARLWQHTGYAILFSLFLSCVLPHVYLFYDGQLEPLPFPGLRRPDQDVAPVRLLSHFGLPKRLALEVVVAVWGTGAALGLFRFLAQLRRAVVLTRSGRALSTAEVRALLGSPPTLHRRPREEIVVRFTPAVPIAACWWFSRPVVVLSARLRREPRPLVRAILLHELGHLELNHTLANGVYWLLRTCFWFNPLVYLALANFRRWAERACDEFAVRQGYDVRDYAALLIRTILDHHGIGPASARAEPVVNTFVCCRERKELLSRLRWLVEQERLSANSPIRGVVARILVWGAAAVASFVRLAPGETSFATGRLTWTAWPPATANAASLFGISLRDYPLDAFIYDRVDPD